MIDSELQQQLRQQYSPDGSVLRSLHLRMLEMLKYLDEVCRANGIHYWLSSGTALGAIRHGGFIPWDDDADIEFLRADYKKLIKVLRKNPHPQFVLQDYTTDPNYAGVVGKLRDKNSLVVEELIGKDVLKYNGAFIDLFCIEPSNGRFLTKWSHKIQLFFLFRVSKIKCGPLRRVLLKFNRLWICGILFPMLSVIGRIGNKKRLRHVIGSGFQAKRNLDDVCETVYVKFEDTELPVPRNYDSYLRGLFGDYSSLPDVEHRGGHFTAASGDKMNIEIY